MIERSHLKIVRAIEQFGSMTAAAEQLCLSQSALSHAMRKLEQSLGSPIWLRQGRELRLTQAGQHLLNVANRVLPQLESAEFRLQQFARGEKGSLRVGMECHPCYQWLLKVVAPFLNDWPGVDIDVKQRFQFGALGAILDYEVDLLVTPDPYRKQGLEYEPVLDYEQVLVVSDKHPLANSHYVKAEQLVSETLLTYPVEQSRLDVYSLFLNPAGLVPQHHKTIETTDIMLQLVASGRGVATLPNWLALEYKNKLPISLLRMGPKGLNKKIYLGYRQEDQALDYLQAFIETAKALKYQSL